jgi:hypothetical protein
VYREPGGVARVTLCVFAGYAQEGHRGGMETTAHTPTLVQRQSGGWLATTGPDDALHIGVTADTEAEVRERFNEAVTAWERLLAAVDTPH